MDLSRGAFRRYTAAVEADGIQALPDENLREPNQKNRTDERTELAAVEYAIAYPALGQVRTGNVL